MFVIFKIKKKSEGLSIKVDLLLSFYVSVHSALSQVLSKYNLL